MSLAIEYGRDARLFNWNQGREREMKTEEQKSKKNVKGCNKN